MSVTFRTNLHKTVLAVTGCLCSQMAPSWTGTEAPKNPEELAKFADPKCPHCQGTGVEVDMQADPAYYVNLCNDNAALILDALGLATEGLQGSASIADFVWSCDQALESPEEFPCRKEEASRVFRLEGGALKFGPRTYTQGITQEGVADRIVRLREFAVKMTALGANEVTWG